MAGRQRQRMGRQRLAHGTGLGDHVVIALGQVHILARQDPEVIVDHREKLEAEGKDRAGRVQLAKGGPCPPRGAGTRAEGFRAHRDGAVDEAGNHDAGRVVHVPHLGADARARGLACRDGLVRAVDIFLGPLAGDPQAPVPDPEDKVRQPAKALRFARALQGRDAPDRRACKVKIAHAFSLSIFAS